MIGIIFIGDINKEPYVDKYIDLLNQNNVDFEIIMWSRFGKVIKRKNYKNAHIFTYSQNKYAHKLLKLLGFIKFSKFIKKIIKRNKYDKLIILTTLTALLCYKLLKKKYKNRYIFDFRDLSYENLKLYKKIVDKIILNSYFTCISSRGFEKVLTKYDYVMAHNFRYSDLKNSKFNKFQKNTMGPLNILYIGTSRGILYNISLMNIFGNDSRFILHIYGYGCDNEKVIEYSKKFSNVVIKGEYLNDEKLRFYDFADLICYNYPSTFNCNYALANKYYDSLIFKKPLIGNIVTYSGKLIIEKNLGISLSFEDLNFSDKVFEYYSNINEDLFNKAINEEINIVLEEDKLYLNKIEEFVNE